jgi:predicted ArsR family transcriptional regulator
MAVNVNNANIYFRKSFSKYNVWMQSTRRRLLEYLADHPAVLVADLSTTLAVTEADIRHHLSILVGEDIVEVVGHLPGPNRGRPPKLYSLTSKAQTDNYRWLADALYKTFVINHVAGNTDGNLQLIAENLAGFLPEDQSLSQRLYQAIQKLNRFSYKARWEAHPRAPQLTFSHCPYSALLPEHPELCQMDAFLLNKLLDTQVKQTEKINPFARKKTCCKFEVMKPSG